jgi:DNA-binding SARP family transcriptional activator
MASEYPTVDPSPLLPHAAAPPPALLAGRYELGELIGEGGMGIVHLARDRALDRQVAVKRLRPGLPVDSPAVVRFLFEAKLTGQLQHPGIPAVHELGTLADGQPFLAMKLVKGQTLQELLRQRSSPADDLGRFVAVFEQLCHAVGYAHAHRVIHRDLKPANIMVGAFGEVQVMDWGLAKVLGDPASTVPDSDADDPDATAALQTEIGTPQPDGSATRTGAVLGTPGYMAPEQAGGEIRKLDARSDVFGLGAILCQILTGRPPYSGKDAQALRLQAIRGDMSDALAQLDSCAAEPELVALCRRCLAQQQQERPADGLAVAAAVAGIRQAAETRARQAELQRERTLVQAAEQTRRRRLALCAALAIVAVLVAGLAASLYQMQRANEERDAKAMALQAEEKAKNEAQQAVALEKAARQQAQKRLAQIEKGVELFAGMLTGINPRAEEKGGDPLYVQLRRKAEKAAAQLEGEVVGDPQAVARLQTILGSTLRELGSYPTAVAVLEKARQTRLRELGADHPDTLATLHNLAAAYKDAGKLPEAIKLFEQVKSALVAKLGADHPDTLATLNNLAVAYQDADKLSEAIKLLTQVRTATVAKLGADHPATLTALNNLAAAYKAAAKLSEAIKLLEQVKAAQVAKLGADHADTLTTLRNLAVAYQDAGKMSEALKLFEQVKTAQVAKLGADHPATLATLHNQAGAYQAAGKLSEAIKLYEQVKEAQVAKLGPDHPDTLRTQNNLALAYQDAGKLSEAIKLFEQVRTATVAKLGADHPATLTALNNLAAAYQAAGKLPDAIKVYEQVRAVQVAKLGAGHPDTLNTLHKLAAGYKATGKLSEALKLYEQVKAAQVAKLGAEHPSTLTTLNNLAAAYLADSKVAEAIKLFKQVKDAFVAKLGADHPDTLTALNNLASAYRAGGRLSEALPLFKQAATGIEKLKFQHQHAGLIVPNTVSAYEAARQYDHAEVWQRRWLAVVKDKAGPQSPAYAGELAGLGLLLLKQEKWTDAEAALRDCLVLRQKAQPQAWATFNTMSMLGEVLLGQKNYTAAEPLLLQGYEGMKQRERTIPPPVRKVRLTEAVERLLRLYEALEKKDDAAKWHKELEALKK